MIPAFVRTLFGMLLVCLIVCIVVSPSIDLPLTTVPAWQATITLLAALAVCLTSVSLVNMWGRHERLRVKVAVTDSIYAHTPSLTCSLLC